MKATGIVRRVDDLGRIVIPKELRRTFGIREGTPMELFTDSCGIILQKYSVLSSIKEQAALYAKAVSQCIGDTPVCVCDADRVIASAGWNSRQLENEKLPELLRDQLANDKEYLHQESTPLNICGKQVDVLVPVPAEKAASGAVLILHEAVSQGTISMDMKLTCARVVATLLALFELD